MMSTSPAHRAAPARFASPRRLRHALVTAALCALSGTAWSAPSATVLFTAGDVHILSATGQTREVQAGAVIASGETVQTGKGHVQLRMVDGAMMSLGERTVLRLDDYHLAATSGEGERGFMSLLGGVLRTISGSIGHPRVDDYKLETPSGTIGIRGTEYTVDLREGLRVGVIGGRVAVCNDGGCVDVPKGSVAFTPSRAVKPVVSVKPLVYLVPANAQEPSVSVSSPAPPPTTATALPASGDRISQYLVAALKPPTTAAPAPAGGSSGDGDVLPSLPGSTVVESGPPPPSQGATAPVTVSPSPAPAPPPKPTPAPSPAPTPAPSPAPTPAPTPAPAPAPAPTPAPSPPPPPSPAPAPVTNPLPNGKATLGIVWSTEKGDVASGLTQGAATFDTNGGLVALDNASSGKKMFDKGVVTDVGADGVIAWGRWTGGQSKVKGATGDGNGVGDGNLATLHYFALEATPAGATTGQFASFASTSPTVQSGGKLVATGAVNSATGTFSASLKLQTGGTASYLLTVPVPGQTFSLAGVASQTSPSGFSGVSLISSTGAGCAGGCTGSLGNNVSVVGQIAGAQGSEAGVTYGFDSRIGNVSGVIVFKH